MLKAGGGLRPSCRPRAVCVLCSFKDFAHMVCPLVSKDEPSVREPSHQGDLEKWTNQREPRCDGSSTSNNPPLSVFSPSLLLTLTELCSLFVKCTYVNYAAQMSAHICLTLVQRTRLHAHLSGWDVSTEHQVF